MKQRAELVERLVAVQLELRTAFIAAVAPCLDREFGDLGRITVRQAEVVGQLLQGREMTMHELADVSGIGASAATQLVDRLERQGLVERFRDDEDRRIQRVVPTPQATAIRRRMRSIVSRSAGEMVETLNDEELQLYVELSERIAAHRVHGRQSLRRTA